MLRHERLVQLCLLLRRSPRPLPLASVAKAAGATERQVVRDIMTLLDAGFPVSGDKIDGFWMGPSVQAALDLLTEQEAERLLLPQALKAALEAGKRKAVPLPPRNLPALPKTRRERAGPVTLDMIRECVRTSRKLRINYEDVDQQRTARVILPVALFYYKNRSLSRHGASFGRMCGISGWTESRRGGCSMNISLTALRVCAKRGKRSRTRG